MPKQRNIKTENTPSENKQNENAENSPELDLSKVVLKIGAASAYNSQAILEAARVIDTPCKVDFTVFQGENLVFFAEQLDYESEAPDTTYFLLNSQNKGILINYCCKKI